MTVAAVIAAHPDDEVLGCGGTIARFAADHDVRIAILCEGEAARYKERGDAPASKIQALRQAARVAADILGANSVDLLGLPDQRLDTLPLIEVTHAIEEWLSQIDPTVVYTHHPGDLNLDHTITARAVMTATRPLPGSRVREVYAFEIPSSTEWSFQQIQPVFRPNTFVDVGATIDAKVRAMEAYAREARPFPHPRSPEAIRAIAQRWGSVVGTGHAEAFELIRSIR